MLVHFLNVGIGTSTYSRKNICIFLFIYFIISRCGVKMDIKIKLITKVTCKRDKDVKTHPCTVIIKGVHNHNTESASALLQLRVLPETIDAFFKYFDLGKNIQW